MTKALIALRVPNGVTGLRWKAEVTREIDHYATGAGDVRVGLPGARGADSEVDSSVTVKVPETQTSTKLSGALWS